MIRFITVEKLLPLRNEVLRGGKLNPHECRFVGDDDEGSFHLGFYQDDLLISAVSFHHKAYEQFDSSGYQLRGMATLENFRNKGIGNQLVNFAAGHLSERQTKYIWCNARKKAVKFYERLGFEVISDEFQVPNIGPHFVMYLKLQD